MRIHCHSYLVNCESRITDYAAPMLHLLCITQTIEIGGQCKRHVFLKRGKW